MPEPSGPVRPANLPFSPLDPASNLSFVTAQGPLDVRTFTVTETLGALFTARIVAMSPDANLAFDGLVGAEASLQIGGTRARRWAGLVAHAEQAGVDEDGLSTYAFVLVPKLWLLSQRRNHRMFQQLSEIEIVQQFFREWEIEARLDLRETYKGRRYRVQYGESDLDFVTRLLEEAGVTLRFEEHEDRTIVVLDDAPHAREARLPIVYSNRAIASAGLEFVTDLAVTQEVRPGRYTHRDHDYRRAPTFPLLASASVDPNLGDPRLERFHYVPGAFLFRSEQGDPSPVADDRGRVRTDLDEANRRVVQRLEAQRGRGRRIHFETTAHDVAPGTVISIAGHPRADVSTPNTFLVVRTTFEGSAEGHWLHRCEAQPTALPFRPELVTPRPRAQGVESATVVGPRGEEIHTDEFGRVRVQFHWDREGQWNETSSAWIHVSQAWGGAGYGAINLPRVGQEVLVDFLGGDPDRPIITGRVYTNLQRVPYQLPEKKTQSGWRSYSSPATGGYNEILFEDAAGSELMNVRAEKDRATRVNNDCSTSIGRDRSAEIGRDDKTTVERDQTITVKTGDRRLVVEEGDLMEVVKKSIVRDAATGDQIFATAQTFLSTATRHVLHSDAQLELHVGPSSGGSSIVMTPTSIVLQADRVFINPGMAGLAAARRNEEILSGEEERRAIDAIEAALRESELHDRIEARRTRTDEEWQRMSPADAAEDARQSQADRVEMAHRRRVAAQQRRRDGGSR